MTPIKIWIDPSLLKLWQACKTWKTWNWQQSNHFKFQLWQTCGTKLLPRLKTRTIKEIRVPVLGLACCHWRHQNRRIGAGTQSWSDFCFIQPATFVGHGPWLYATSACNKFGIDNMAPIQKKPGTSLTCMDSVHSWGSDEWSEDEWKKTVERGRRLWNDEHSADTGGGEGKKKQQTPTQYTWLGAGKPWKGRRGEKRRPTETDHDQRPLTPTWARRRPTLTDLTANMINFWIGAYLFFTKYHPKNKPPHLQAVKASLRAAFWLAQACDTNTLWCWQSTVLVRN